MKKLMIFSAALIFAIFAGMIIYVAVAPEFVEPIKADTNVVPPEDNEIWNKTLDDLAQFLLDQGLVDSTDIKDFDNCNICTRWVTIGSNDDYKGGVEFAFWDLKNLSKDDTIYKKYVIAVEEGYLDGGSAFTVSGITIHGPFAYTYMEEGYKYDINDLIETFDNWCMDKE